MLLSPGKRKGEETEREKEKERGRVWVAWLGLAFLPAFPLLTRTVLLSLGSFCPQSQTEERERRQKVLDVKTVRAAEGRRYREEFLSVRVVFSTEEKEETEVTDSLSSMVRMKK